MKVLILSTYSQTGGAAIAASRLLQALRKKGVEATMLCRRNISWGPERLRKQSWSCVWERMAIWCLDGFSKTNLWTTDIACCGQDITDTKEYKEADVVHLHWVNQGFLSFDTIGKIVKSGKRIVWTMHDEWPLDSIWHYTDGLSKAEKDKWIARHVSEKKRKIYSSGNITFVTCSKWLKNVSQAKPLAEGQEIVTIPNPIDTELFKPVEHKQRRCVLFVAQKVNDERKGIKYLDAARELLDDIEVVALGRDIPYIHNKAEMAALYASVDVFVTPSLQDNLPNTIMEAMACGTPCVGFNVGGIPEMIEHKENGYVARYKDAADLAEGIRYVLDNSERLGKNAREKVMREYSEDVVAGKYIEIYAGKNS